MKSRVRAARAVERFHVGRELDQVAGDEPRGEPQVPQNWQSSQAESRQEPLPICQRFLRRLHARLQADDVVDVAPEPAVEPDQEVDGAGAGRRSAGAQRLAGRGARPRPSPAKVERGGVEVGAELRRQRSVEQERRQFVVQGGVVGEREVLGLGLRKKSNGLNTAISATRSTSTRNSRVGSGNTSRAR